jgi:hypothetical protein
LDRFLRLAFVAAAIFAAMNSSPGRGANYSWQVTSGNWTSASNWNPSVVPGVNDTGWIVNGGTAQITSAVTCNAIAVGGLGTGNVQLTSGVSGLTAAGEYIGYNGVGTLNQSALTNSATSFLSVGNHPGANGSYILSGGSLWTGSTGEYIGDNGSGTLTQTAGTNATSGPVAVGNNAGSNGSYNLGGSGYFVSPNLYVGLSGSSTGTFSQTGGTNSVSSNLGVGNNAGSTGSYNLSGSGYLLVSDNEYVGNYGSGVFTQSGGTHSTTGSLNLGYLAGSSGTYSLSGGLLTSLGTLNVGNSGSGTFIQTGGTNNLSVALTLGLDAVASGSYTLSGNGRVAAASEYVGYQGSANFWQSGGTNTISGPLYLGYRSSYSTSFVAASYILSGSGRLSAGSEFVGDSPGPGGFNQTFTQTGGTNAISGALYLGYAASDPAQYDLRSGLLTAASEFVGNSSAGIFNQGGGTNTVVNAIVDNGYYQLGNEFGGGVLLRTGGNGMLQVINGGFQGGGGTLACTGFTTIVAGTGALLDISGLGVLANTASISLSVGSDSLLILPAGFNPAVFASYSNSGLAHTLGTTLNVSAGTGFGGWGTIVDPVSCQGTVLATQDGFINLYNGLALTGTGQVSLGGYSPSSTPPVNGWGPGNMLSALIVNDTGFSKMTGGSLAAEWLFVGASGPGYLSFVGSDGTGSFPQSGGTASVGSGVVLGNNPGDTGAYVLSGSGQLNAAFVIVGYSGSGGFTQYDGTCAMSGNLTVGSNSGSRGSYYLYGGLLSSSNESIGGSGTGSFTQNGGTNSVDNLVLGSSAASSYNLAGGLLLVSGLYGDPAAVFRIGGGTFQAAGDLTTDVSVALTAAGSNADFDPNGNTLTLLGNIGGSGGLAEIGSGMLVLSGTNTYTGGTFVGDGTLIADNSQALANGSDLTVGNAAAFAPVIPSASAGSLVPEPSTLALLIVGAALIWRRGARRWSAMPRRASPCLRAKAQDWRWPRRMCLRAKFAIAAAITERPSPAISNA